jgi:exopolysaccharide biosynthesis polyprenyl glycosylphosphotransferase
MLSDVLIHGFRAPAAKEGSGTLTELEVGQAQVAAPLAYDVNRVSIPFLRIQERKLLLAGVDLLIAFFTMWGAYLVWRTLHPTATSFTHVPWEWLIGGAMVWLTASWLAGAYDLGVADWFGRAARVTLSVAVASWGAALLATFVFLKTYPRPSLAIAAVALPLLVLGWRRLYVTILRRPAAALRLIVVGNATLFQALASVAAGQEHYYRLLGFVGASDSDDPHHLGDTGDLLRLTSQLQAHRIIVAPRLSLPNELVIALSHSVEQGVEVADFSSAYEDIAEKVAVEHAGDFWMASLPTRTYTSPIEDLAMRFLDVIGGMVGILLTALLFPLIALAILIDSGRPVFYRQDRLGRGGKPFTLAKFRSMRQDAECGTAQWATAVDSRVTRAGRFLRRTHIDELPQFWNVLTGDMSLVGPRPERPSFTDHLAESLPFYRLRLAVRPGLTGLKQIRFGYAATVEEHLEVLRHDLYYIKHRSLGLNVVVIARTLGRVFGMKGR